MPREFVAPVVEEKNDPHVDTIERHPAYGQIGASRVSGRAQLYGSDFEHNNYITIRLYKSELHRNLSNDTPMTRGGDVMEVSLSESQWATFVSSLNAGQGVPCTINYLNGEGDLPGIRRTVNRRAQFEDELNTRLKEVEANVHEIAEKVKALPVSQKKKDEILHDIRVTLNNMAPNLKFTQEQFGEYMEDTTNRAKAEINAYAQRMFAAPTTPALDSAPAMPVRMLEGEVVDADVQEN
jgi:hypothetical protein